MDATSRRVREKVAHRKSDKGRLDIVSAAVAAFLSDAAGRRVLGEMRALAGKDLKKPTQHKHLLQAGVQAVRFYLDRENATLA